MVKTLVGSTFDQFVENSNKYIVIAFINSGESESRRLEAFLNLLAFKFHLNSDIVFAKINALDNDYSKPFKEIVNKFPSICFLASYENAKPILYRGDFEIDSMENFINEQLKLSVSRQQKAKPITAKTEIKNEKTTITTSESTTQKLETKSEHTGKSPMLKQAIEEKEGTCGDTLNDENEEGYCSPENSIDEKDSDNEEKKVKVSIEKKQKVEL